MDSEAMSPDDWMENRKVEAILKEHLDETDYRIYKALNEDGRMSDTELGERVGLSRTAARRRRKNLQENGIVEVIGVLVLQEAQFAYADVFVTLEAGVGADELDAFIEHVQNEELIYEIEEYMGKYDLLLRVWHASLSEIKGYLRSQLQDHAVVEQYEAIPVTKTHKAWHRKMTNGE